MSIEMDENTTRDNDDQRRTLASNAISLEENVAHLGRAVQNHRELLNILRTCGAVLGGGSVLAALWNGHRLSTDLDLMIRNAQFAGHAGTLESALRGIESKTTSVTIVRRRGMELPITLTAHEVGSGGNIEIVRDRLGDEYRIRHPKPAGPRLWGLVLNAEDPVYIPGKKFHRLTGRAVERDHYDIVYAAGDRRTSPEWARSSRRHSTITCGCGATPWNGSGCAAARRGRWKAIPRHGKATW